MGRVLKTRTETDQEIGKRDHAREIGIETKKKDRKARTEPQKKSMMILRTNQKAKMETMKRPKKRTVKSTTMNRCTNH